MTDADTFALRELGEVIDGITDCLYGMCRALQLAGIERDALVKLLDAVIADARRSGTKRSLVPEAVKVALLRWENMPPEQRLRLRVIDGDRDGPVEPRPAA